MLRLRDWKWVVLQQSTIPICETILAHHITGALFDQVKVLRYVWWRLRAYIVRYAAESCGMPPACAGTQGQVI